MIELGKIQKLEIAKYTSFGAYLSDKDDKENTVLLPKKEVPENSQLGDEVEVFIYRDSQDRMIATTRKPKITLGELAVLKVVETTKIGAFLDWGLEKDLLLPFKEQTHKVEQGRGYLVGLYIDKSDRFCATMDVHRLLTSNSSYKENDKVTGIIYSLSRDIGAFVAVDNKYYGLIPNKEFYGNYKYGDKVEVRVTKVKEDGKLNLSLREKAYKQMDDDAMKILEKVISKGGFLRLNDNSSADKIKSELNMSKSAFKRGVGRLLKQRKIKMTDKGIELL